MLFFDEIQSCPKAIASLRFFYEKTPELHIIAAGSLLEFALSEIPTFGVGRIRSFFMYPLSFSEFLNGAGEHQLLEKIREAKPEKPLNEIFHVKLIELIQKFICLGGMPEVLATYFESRDFNQCQQMLDDLIISLQADFAKYRKRVAVSRLNEVLNYFVKKDLLSTQSKFITIALVIILLIISILYHDRLYTFTTCLFLIVTLLIHLFVIKSAYLGRFYLAWLVCLIPFFIVNEVLTAMPVLIYADEQNLGIRLFTIPLEDVFYGMLNILQVITVYEWLKSRELAN